jgi:sigma-54 dependent transcriptional regulator, acetoin dehydrogenase operon transcriptional activator AcoR
MGETMDERDNAGPLQTYSPTAPLPHAAVGMMEVIDHAARRVRDPLPAEIRREGLVTKLQRRCDDLRTIFNQLPLGIIMTDQTGYIVLMNLTAQHLCGTTQEAATGRPWPEVITCQKGDASLLQSVARRPIPLRTRVPVCLEGHGGQRFHVAIDVLDDPRHQRCHIFLLAELSEGSPRRHPRHEGRPFPDLIGQSTLMQRVYQQIHEVAEVDATVLIEGETGTGKELVARAIHKASPRHPKPFVAVNCAGLTESLVASQLFGHKRGAFTGAVTDHIGFFEAAEGGTLFLDEIGDMPLTVQTSLLRVLQDREFTRLGESRVRKIDVRIVTATHRDLNAEVARGTFRTDLLYRIRVARIHLPPLRERREDVPLLVNAFLAQATAAGSKMIHEVSLEAMQRLLEYPWPGNVRELKNAIDFAVIRSHGFAVEVNALPPEMSAATAPPRLWSCPPAEDHERLLAAMEMARGNRVVAARLLGISRSTLYRRLARLPHQLPQGLPTLTRPFGEGASRTA